MPENAVDFLSVNNKNSNSKKSKKILVAATFVVVLGVIAVALIYFNHLPFLSRNVDDDTPLTDFVSDGESRVSLEGSNIVRTFEEDGDTVNIGVEGIVSRVDINNQTVYVKPALDSPDTEENTIKLTPSVNLQLQILETSEATSSDGFNVPSMTLTPLSLSEVRVGDKITYNKDYNRVFVTRYEN